MESTAFVSGLRQHLHDPPSLTQWIQQGLRAQTPKDLHAAMSAICELMQKVTTPRVAVETALEQMLALHTHPDVSIRLDLWRMLRDPTILEAWPIADLAQPTQIAALKYALADSDPDVAEAAARYIYQAGISLAALMPDFIETIAQLYLLRSDDSLFEFIVGAGFRAELLAAILDRVNLPLEPGHLSQLLMHLYWLVEDQEDLARRYAERLTAAALAGLPTLDPNLARYAVLLLEQVYPEDTGPPMEVIDALLAAATQKPHPRAEHLRAWLDDILTALDPSDPVARHIRDTLGDQ